MKGLQKMEDNSANSPHIEDGLRGVPDVLKAAHFAAVRHSGQRRKGVAAEPYINHLLEVAELVSSALSEPDTNLVIAALLHDTIEDAGVTREELIQTFGTDVAGLVVEVTDNKTLPKAERKRLQIVNAPKKSVRAQVIKLADKISNLRAILSSPPADWSEQRKWEYFEWAKQVVNGLSAPNPKLKAEFERLYREAETPDSAIGTTAIPSLSKTALGKTNT
jgi:GTP diphosphokinase / guanosine-3',5'-bis(diphosphate) 3'-diphosphatase